MPKPQKTATQCMQEGLRILKKYCHVSYAHSFQRLRNMYENPHAPQTVGALVLVLAEAIQALEKAKAEPHLPHLWQEEQQAFQRMEEKLEKSPKLRNYAIGQAMLNYISARNNEAGITNPVFPLHTQYQLAV